MTRFTTTYDGFHGFVTISVTARVNAARTGVMGTAKMASAVIRIDERTHATLRAWASAEHKPIGQVVTELVDRQASEKFWSEIRDAYDRLQEDPAAWKDYRDEAALLEGGSMDGLANEEPYYSPEEVAEIEEYAKSQGW